MFPVSYTLLHSPFISARERPPQETHQGVRSLTVPALQPVRHTFVTPNPSIHFSPLRHKYIFLFSVSFIKGKPELHGKHAHTHTSRAGRSPGPVILHLHFSHLADALIQSDVQRVQRLTEPECGDVGESTEAGCGRKVQVFTMFITLQREEGL